MENSFEGIAFPNFDPVAISIFGILQIRWYALAYLGGFLGGWAYGSWLVKEFGKNWRPNKEDIFDILPWVALGVILGGRLGYVLFYNLEFYLQNPLHILFVWEGGMSFHGGLAGVIIAMFLYAKSEKIPLLQLSDIIAAVVPIGIFFGRISNFINGELFGRVTTKSWGVIFPYGGEYPRHPSQLYEALSEGLLLFIILYIMTKYLKLWQKPGIITGSFLSLYAFFRFMIEFVREPDPQLGFFGEYFSMGQLLSLPMFLLGIYLILYAYRQKKNNV